MTTGGVTISFFVACARSTFPLSFAAALSLSLLALTPASAVPLHHLRTHATEESCGKGLSTLEAKLHMMYQALPHNAQGLPEASAIRYMARRYLTVEHGWVMKGLDIAPVHLSKNVTEAATHRAAQLVQVPDGLPQAHHEALSAVLANDRGRGFSLCEATHVVSALEQVVANGELIVLRRAHHLAKATKDTGGSTPMYRVLENYAALYMAGTEMEQFFAPGTRSKNEDVNKRLAMEVQLLKDDLKHDLTGEPLEVTVQAAARDATAGGKTRGGSGVVKGMQRLRARLSERQAGECRKYRELLASLDTDGTGQVRYATVYGMQVKDWAMYETPEYLRAVGALEEVGVHGGGPGVLIPNYIISMNSCREPGQRDTVMCCPDECEATIIPRVEALANGPRATAEQVWSAIYQPLMADRVAPAELKKTFHAKLFALALQSKDGRIAVHGDELGNWLHQAFPHTCPKPAPRKVMPVVDTGLFLSEWMTRGSHVSVDTEEVAVIKEHLTSRWGLDGTGTEPGCFAMRSSIGLDSEIQLIHELFSKRQKDDPPVLEQLDSVLNVWALEHSTLSMVCSQMVAMIAAIGTLAVLALLYVLAFVLGILAGFHALAAVVMGAVATTAKTGTQLARFCIHAFTVVAAIPGNIVASCSRAVTALWAECCNLATTVMVVFNTSCTELICTCSSFGVECCQAAAHFMAEQRMRLGAALASAPNAAYGSATAFCNGLLARSDRAMAAMAEACSGAKAMVADAFDSCTRRVATLNTAAVHNVDKVHTWLPGWDQFPSREQGIPIWAGASIAALIATFGIYAGAGDEDGAGVELLMMGMLVVAAICFDRFNVVNLICEPKSKCCAEPAEVSELRATCSKYQRARDFGDRAPPQIKGNPNVASAPWRGSRGVPRTPQQRGSFYTQQPAADGLRSSGMRPSQSTPAPVLAPPMPTMAPPPGFDVSPTAQVPYGNPMPHVMAKPAARAEPAAPGRLSGLAAPPGLKLTPEWCKPQPKPAAASEATMGLAGSVASSGGCLDGKTSLLLDMLREEKRRTPEALTEKGKLLLEVLCEEELQKRQTVTESQAARPTVRAPPPGLSLAPPPGLRAPPGLAGLAVE